MAPEDVNQYVDPTQPVEFFTAFITDTGEGFEIEELVARRKLNVDGKALFGLWYPQKS